MQNIEIKIRVSDLSGLRHHLKELGYVPQAKIIQVDTYFRTSTGRLKLRELEVSSDASLISYLRPDNQGSRISHYRILSVQEPEAMKSLLAESLGILTVVRKHRELYIIGHTRIHLDSVEGLGTFLELETVVGAQGEDDAWREHRDLRAILSIADHEPVPVSYSDLKIGKQARHDDQIDPAQYGEPL
jgi:adenylate cyclase, class 2